MNYYLKTVLLIDDNPIDNYLNENLIYKNSFAEKVVVSVSAEEAIIYLKINALVYDRIPDLIFLDIKMPLGDGFEFLEAYRDLSEEIIKKAKIIMLTSSLDKADHTQAIENKFVKYLIKKPLSIEILNDLRLKL